MENIMVVKIENGFITADTKQELKETVHLACGKEMQIKFVDKKPKCETNTSEFEKIIGNNGLPFNII